MVKKESVLKSSNFFEHTACKLIRKKKYSNPRFLIIQLFFQVHEMMSQRKSGASITLNRCL